MLGAGQDHHCVFGVIMGTGCGGGLVINQQIRIGPQRLSGEWGHMTIDPNGPLCFCGKRGCVETFISGSGLESMFLEKAARPLCAQDIFQLAAQGDPNASLILDIFYDQFGRAISNLIHLLDPDVIVLGGGLSNQDAIYQRGIDAVQRHLFSDELTTPIIKNHLGDSAGVIGAALIGI
jgi:fructokinase